MDARGNFTDCGVHHVSSMGVFLLAEDENWEVRALATLKLHMDYHSFDSIIKDEEIKKSLGLIEG